MRHFPIFVDLHGQRVAVSGAGETAAAKLRLLLKTQADIHVYGDDAHEVVRGWANDARLTLHERAIAADDVAGARLVYGANDDDPHEDARVADLARAAGVLVNLVDNLDGSQFITPAIVDRDPVTVAIGTEGAAPVLARRIKAQIETMLPATLGVLAQAAAAFRDTVEAHLPMGRLRRVFWSAYFDGNGERALEKDGEAGLAAHLKGALDRLLANDNETSGRVDLVGAGPGDPELLTLKARTRLHEADVVLYDRLVDPRVLELARREAVLIEVGKTAFGESWKQDDINAEMVRHARDGHHVVRLKSGDPLVFGRADEEMDALEGAGIPFAVVPGITSAVAAAAQARVSLTRRGRNSELRFITAHDAKGFAEHEWRTLASGRTAAAVYMGVKAARFLQGRLLIHGGARDLAVTVVENISRTDERRVDTTLGRLAEDMDDAGIRGPAILLVGLAARSTAARGMTESIATPRIAASAS